VARPAFSGFLSSTIRIAGWTSLVILALIGLVVVVTGVGSRALGLYGNSVAVSELSPDGKYVAEIVTSEQPFDTETLVTISRKPEGKGQTVLAYEVPQKIDIGIRWRDQHTLSISLPCIPPNLVRPAFRDYDGVQLRRIIVEARPIDPGCRFGRGVSPDGGFPEDKS